MDRSQLRVIKGGVDIERAPESGTKSFAGAWATDSRLMGVFVIYLRWAILPDEKTFTSPEFLHQYFYIEVQEFGLESYKSIRGNDEAVIHAVEQEMIGGLGAERVELNEREARILLHKYSQVNAENDIPLPEGEFEYGFMLESPPDYDDLEFDLLFARICHKVGDNNELINYFLMRFFAGDVDAVRYLGVPGSADKATEYYDDTLLVNKIKPHQSEDGEESFISESLIESENQHKIVVSEIHIASDKYPDGSSVLQVGKFGVISEFEISNAETAMKLERPEFITVYETFVDPQAVTDFLDEHYPGTMKRDTEAGRVYLKFNDTNDHVKNSLYRLNDDIYGMYYMTDEAQLICAAYSLVRIHRLEHEVNRWPFSRQLVPIAKYEFKEDVFYDFLGTDLGDFVHYVDSICDFDPEPPGRA